MGDVIPASTESQSLPPKQLLSSALALDLLEGIQLEISIPSFTFFSFENHLPSKASSLAPVSPILKPLSHLFDCEMRHPGIGVRVSEPKDWFCCSPEIL